MTSTTQSTMLEVKNLNKRFGTVHAVKDLSFHVCKGEVFGFLGPNGAGKSTTMRIITCFIPATDGSVKVDGLDNIEHDLEVRKKIGYLPETTPLYNEMMVCEYLRFVGEIRGLRAPRLDSRIDEMVTTCGLTKMVNRPIGALSKGFRQRVGLAQAMIHDPDLLILDEPTVGLDPNQIVEIRQLIKKMGQEKTVLYCSHILSEVAATCDRILIINDGSLVATGTPQELTANSSRQEQYRMRCKAPAAELQSRIGALEGVARVSVKEVTGEWRTVEVAAESGRDLGESLFKTAVENNWVLSELKQEAASLEDVFTQLTKG